uniref:Cytosol aminopeptidase domain-containing protein n=1 Tax=Timema douglasi TaxID=61478 RepID=A0A7R8VI06_TIMDO|nr:unnamed protein product [Timema douglasi]
MASLPYQVKAEGNLNSSVYDGIVYVTHSPPESGDHPEPLKKAIQGLAKVSTGKQLLRNDMVGTFLPNMTPPKIAFDSTTLDFNALMAGPEVALPARRLVYSPTGKINREYHDVRSFSEAAGRGIKRALKAGMKSPLLVLTSHERFKQSEVVTLLGALEALYVPIQFREDVPSKSIKVKELGVWSKDFTKTQELVNLAKILESGRYVARDIGGGDPERMAPPRVEEYVKEIFAGSPIKIEVISDPNKLDKEYPLFSAVDRAARVIERHRGRIIYLTYEPAGLVTETLFLVGKGVTYDTGGADIKAGGVMAGMSRDKCGSAAVAGFMKVRIVKFGFCITKGMRSFRKLLQIFVSYDFDSKVISALKPKDVKVVAAMSMVRNSIGENCYVADEVITSRSQARVRIGNTDAEGRMIMADVLCYMKELAASSVNPHLLTIATLTGHAVLTVGSGFSILMDNGPAREVDNSRKLRAAAEEYGDMIEISTIRREDMAFHKEKELNEIISNWESASDMSDIDDGVSSSSSEREPEHEVDADNNMTQIQLSVTTTHVLDSYRPLYSETTQPHSHYSAARLISCDPSCQETSVAVSTQPGGSSGHSPSDRVAVTADPDKTFKVMSILCETIIKIAST